MHAVHANLFSNAGNVGTVLIAFLTSRFGRKLVLLTGSAGHFVVALCSAFSPNYATFVTLRFFQSVFSTFAYLTAFVIGEWSSTSDVIAVLAL